MEEQLYQDFTTKLLPKIAEGLTLTKDYFLDLFGRYVKYLIVSDTISLVLSVLVLIIAIVSLILLRHKMVEWWEDFNPASIFLSVLIVVSTIASVIGICVNTSHLVKDIYIPEVRVYQSLQGCSECRN